MSTLAEMCESHIHCDVPAEECLLDKRSRALESYVPKPVPLNATSDAAVIAPIDVPLPINAVAGSYVKEALSAATALFSNVMAKF